ncbi:hypothetical protein ACFW2V_13395 [Streptomyces sp. NPDC058947]|uniref:hypothetical protein n=1 Tax=Streptomyces sp. NPDC058947 TaxID=3346675 RepID=UPI0036CBCC74
MMDWNAKLREYRMNGSKTVFLPEGTTIVALGARSGDKSGWEDYARTLEAGIAFRTSGDFCGAPVQPGATDLGRLDTEWRASLERADYVVWSWWTPIAWRIPGEGWVIPAAGTFGQDVETRSTVRHINKIRTAVRSFAEYRETPAV